MSFFNIIKKKNLLSNNPVLYATAVVAFLNILGFLQIGKINIVLLYIVLGLLLSYYTKHMVIILGVPLLIINFVSYMGFSREGMEERELDDIDDIDDIDGIDINLNDNLQKMNDKLDELTKMVSIKEEEEEEEEY
jgi:hypothetical protein